MVAEEGHAASIEAAFKQLMQEQKVRAREARKALGDLGWAGVEFGKEIPATTFIGYTNMEAEGKIVAIVADEELQRCDHRPARMQFLSSTRPRSTPKWAARSPTMAPIHTETARIRPCTDVQKNKGGKFMHYGKLVSGSLAVGDTVTASIDAARRKAIMRAHSATHLLDYALRTVLGDHAHQAGSLVEPDRLRYDFTHFSAVTAEELVEDQPPCQ